MRHVIESLVVVVAIASSGGAAHGQSLAEVARKEEARRKAVTVPARVYTNEDLSAAPESSPATAKPADAGSVDSVSAVVPSPAAAASQPVVLAVPGSGGDAVPAALEEERDEAFWRSTITRARDALDRSRVLTDALQSRLNALATDIVNRDDPAQRAQLELERQRALAELDRVRAEVAAQTRAIADIEEDARKAGVPPGWLR